MAFKVALTFVYHVVDSSLSLYIYIYTYLHNTYFCHGILSMVTIYIGLMELFSATIYRNSVSLFRFPLYNHVQVNSCAISFVCIMKCPFRWGFFSSFLLSRFNNSYFPVCSCIIIFFFLLLVATINISLLLFAYSSIPWLTASTQSSILAYPLPLYFLVTVYPHHLLCAMPCECSTILSPWGLYFWV